MTGMAIVIVCLKTVLAGFKTALQRVNLVAEAKTFDFLFNCLSNLSFENRRADFTNDNCRLCRFHPFPQH